eukprot:1806383-Prymnesium_polylepis.1
MAGAPRARHLQRRARAAADGSHPLQPRVGQPRQARPPGQVPVWLRLRGARARARPPPRAS